MTESEVLQLLAEALEVDASTLSMDTVIAEVADWGSLGWLSIMSLVDERLSMQIDAKAIEGFATAGDVVRYIRSKSTGGK